MNNDIMGYRYTRNELETLRLILDIDLPLGVEPVQLDEESYHAAFEALCDADILVNAGERVLVDPLTALLMRQASASSLCLRIRSDQRHTLLHRAPNMFLLSECTSRNCTLTPLQYAHHVAEPIARALSRHEAPLILEIMEDGQLKTIEAATPADAQIALKDYLARLRVHYAN